MTLSKLAKLANVSVSVVSKAFSGKGEVSEEMREHVFSVAREHGCFQQFYHVPYDRPVIAVIIPEAISHAYIRYVEALKKRIQESGCTMLLSISNFDPDLCADLIGYYTSHSKVDGLIVVDGRVTKLPTLGSTATAFLGTPKSNLTEGVCISSDLGGGVNEIIRTLYLEGHKRIAFVGDPITVKKGNLIREALVELGMNPPAELFINSHARFEDAGADGVERLWKLEKKPTAIVGAYGYITKGILAALSAHGVRVPEDVSVVSLNDDPSPLHETLDVATLRSDTDHACHLAMEILLERMQTDDPNPLLHISIPADFHVGNTIREIGK